MFTYFTTFILVFSISSISYLTCYFWKFIFRLLKNRHKVLKSKQEVLTSGTNN